MIKSIREMSERERRRNSLSAKTVRSTVMGCAVLGLIALIIGLGLYGNALAREYIRHAYDTADHVSASVELGADSVGLAEQVMEIYRSLSEEERLRMGTDAYSELFSDVSMEKGSPYDILMHMMGDFISSEEINDVYLAMYDQETSALVYMVDPEEEYRFDPGEWEAVSAREVSKFLNWDGTGQLYDVSNTKKYGWMCTAGKPIRNEDGEICAFVLTDVTIDKVLHGMLDYVLQIVVCLLIVTALIAWRMVHRIRKMIVTPINDIADAAMAYAGDKQAGKMETHRFDTLDIQTGDELENLSLIMGDMEQNLTKHEERITRISAEKERIGTELRMATAIQESMLPNTFPPYPNRPEFDIYAGMYPAKEVGGDFYDFYLIDDDHLCMVIADVSGKGVPAALFMMVCKVIVQSCAMLGRSAADILTKTNEAICSNNQMEMFITVWLGILELSTGIGKAANAGHEYPCIKRGDSFRILKDKHSLVIGGMDDVKYKEYEFCLEPGDKLFVYTDGVPEATNRHLELFGTERMLEALNRGADASPQQILDNVKQAVDEFVGDAEQFDDLTMLCLEYKGKEHDS